MANSSRVFELRYYTAGPGKRDALERRFKEHTFALFAKHGITVDAFFRGTDDDETIVYLCSYESREAAKAAWASFQGDPEWISTKAASEVDGVLAAKVQSTFLEPTELSALR